MHFPVYVRLGPVALHPHQTLELLACFVGFRLYLRLKRGGDPLPRSRRLALLAAAAVGAAAGSRVLAWAADPAFTAAHWTDGSLLLAGKTIVGGLLGGLVAVEAAKKAVGERTATGDLYVFPLVVAIAIGRVGCFLTGLADDTYGTATALPWGVDFGDGIARHPTQLYEIAFLAVLGAALWWRSRGQHINGDLFKLFMAGYLAWRLAVDFIKPAHFTLLGMSPIQLACVAGLAWYAPHLPRLLGISAPPSPSPSPETTAPAWQTR